MAVEQREKVILKEAQLPAAESSQHKWWVLFAIGIGTFMSALDGSVVNISLPTIARSFGSTVADIEWVVTIYLLVLSGLLLSFGRLGDLRGHKDVYITGFIIFISSSILCGFARGVTFLIVFRAIQALGAAMLSANSPAILTKSFPAHQRGQALGIQATMTYLGLTVGPSLGGWLTGIFGWPSVFYINVPVGLFALYISLRFIARDRGRSTAERFDLAGASLFLAGLVALLLGLNKGHDWGWTSLPVIGLLVTAAVLLGFFLLLEQKVPYPMLDLSLFRVRIFSLAATSAILNYLCLYSIMFLMPFYLIQGRGLSPAEAGVLLTAQPVIMAIVAPLSGTLSDRIGSRLLSTLGMAILAIGLFLLSGLEPDASKLQIAFYLGVTGLGTGIFISPNNSALMGSAPRQRQGIAAGILATARNAGMVLGVGLAGAIFTTVLAHDQAAGGAAAALAIFHGFSLSLLVAAGIAVIGSVVAVVREV